METYKEYKTYLINYALHKAGMLMEIPKAPFEGLAQLEIELELNKNTEEDL